MKHPEKQSFYKKWRKQILPVRPEDHPVIALGKHIGFAAFLVLMTVVSVAVLAGIAFAL